MTIIIEKKRRNSIKNIVLSVLKKGSSASLPLQIMDICKSYSNIRLIPFSFHMKRRGLTYEEAKQYCGSNDACVDFYSTKNRYIIYYNDIDKTNIVNSNRYRWNIAHELGHVLLEHHKINDRTRIFRSSISDVEYDYYEAEADYFAQLLLVPHVVLYAFKIKNATNIKYLCKISKPASYRRFLDYDEWVENINGNDPYDNELFHLYFNYIYKKTCTICNATLVIIKGSYCPICGEKSMKWGDGKMIYEKAETYENNKLKKCLVCGNEETDIEGEYCQICNTLLVNKCDTRNEGFNYSEDNLCGQVLPTNARYCPVCGNRSTFYNDNLLKAWDHTDVNERFRNTSEDIDEELPFN